MSLPAQHRRNERRRERYHADPEYRAVQKARSNERAPAYKAKVQAAYRVRLGPEELAMRARRVDLWRYYALTPEAYDALLAAQGGRCAVCRSTDPGGRPRFGVDHDHVSGRIRGLLCSKCNIALGLVSDKVETLQALIEYLRENA